MNAATAKAAALASARLGWQLGLWENLVTLDPATRRSARERAEWLSYIVQGALQTGREAVARQALDSLREVGAGREVLLRAVLSSAFNSLSRSWLLSGEPGKAARCMERSVGFYPGLGEAGLVSHMRLDRQARNLIGAGAPIELPSQEAPLRRLFIDCGGHDGCSAIQFLTANPHYDCVTFEPNRELWAYYEEIPTQLIGKAAYTYDGEIEFIIDPVDADGSSIFSDKKIDFTDKVRNEDCPVVRVPCVDLSAFVAEAARSYDVIVLKLDIEGAEYDILEKMIEDGTIAHIARLKCEFHGEKIGLDPSRHERVVAETARFCSIDEWDARPFAVHGNVGPLSTRRLRQALIAAIHQNREVMSNAGGKRI